MSAFASFFRSITKKSQSKYVSLMPDMLNILPPLKEADASEELSKAFVALIELAELSPKIFRGLFNNLVKFSISVIGDKELSDQVRQDGLELMATFADYAPSMCKKDPDYAQEMVTQCLNLMTDVGLDDDDAAIWSSIEDVSRTSLVLDHVILFYADLLRNSWKVRTLTQTMSPESNVSTGWPINSAAKLFSLPPLRGFLG